MNIAFILNGYLRTWEYTKYSFKNLFDMFKTLERDINIKVFINTWDLNKFSSIENIIKDDKFDKLTLIKQLQDDLILINDQLDNTVNVYNSDIEFLKNLKWFEEYHKIAYLRYLSVFNVKHFEKENNMQFDIIYITRPDIWWANPQQKKKIYIPNNFEILTFGESISDLKNAVWQNIPRLNDLVIGCNSKTLNLIGNEFWFLLSTPSILNKVGHSAQYFYYISNNIKMINNLSDALPQFSIVRHKAVCDNRINFKSFDENTLLSILAYDQI